jgi:N-acetylglucosamine-6-sulfatase
VVIADSAKKRKKHRVYKRAITMSSLLLLLAVSSCGVLAAPRPSFVFILTDDQDLLLGGTSAMPVLAREMVAGGTSLRGYVDVPVCCPSRTSTLSGRYAHNLNDTLLGWCGNFRSEHENRTWIGDLRRAGYQTAIFGKMTNDYSDFCGRNIEVPADFTYASILCNDNKFFGNAFNVNGTMRVLPADAYMTNFIGNSSLAWLSAAAADASTPFFLYIAPHAPHVPATPAHEYENAPLASDKAPRTPAWDYGTAHHHWLVSEKAPLTPALVNFSDALFARRLRATMSVDDIVAAVFAALGGAGRLADTFVIYTSDHGYNLGTFRLPSGKFHVFENDLRVPFFVRGPGVAAGASRNALVNNVDVAATVLDLAGVAPSRVIDGRSFASQLAADAPAWPRDRLVHEYWGLGYTERGPCSNGTGPCPGGAQALEDAPSNSWSGLRVVNATHDVLYAEYRPTNTAPIARGSTNFTFACNNTADPYQLVNVARQWPAAELQRWSDELWAVATCVGAQCP